MILCHRPRPRLTAADPREERLLRQFRELRPLSQDTVARVVEYMASTPRYRRDGGVR